MPVLIPRQAPQGSGRDNISGDGNAAVVTNSSVRSRAFPMCSNPRCTTGWLQIWRKRNVPVVEGGWVCSPECTRARMEDLLRREQANARPSTVHQHRIPIGLILLSHGWITRESLKLAVEAQRNGSKLRLGEWLIAHCGLSEARLTQALSLQWNCPAFTLARHGSGLPVTVVPRLFSESFGFVPIRLTASGVLYLAFEDRMDHSLSLSIERMTGFRVESGLLGASEFSRAGKDQAQGRFPRTRLVEAGNTDLLAEVFTRHIEKTKPAEARLVRMRDLFWLRMWRRADAAAAGSPPDGGTEDVIGSVVRF